MADFIAVIRRAVDGLSENTPEMRAKVYERAKSAVVRQLENMKPRPPEVMFQRQLDKLDAAIREVEAEHAEALPGDDLPDTVAADEPEAAEPPPAAFVAPEPAPEAVVPDSEPAPAARRAEPVYHQEPASTAIIVERASEPAATQEPVEQQPVVPAYVAETPAEPVARLEPEAHPAQLDVKPYDAALELGSKQAPADTPQPVVETASVIPAAGTGSTAIADELIGELAAKTDAEPARQWSVEVDEEPEVAAPDAVEEDPAPPMPKVSYDESDVVAGFNDFVKEELNRQVVPPPPVKTRKEDDFSWDAPFDDLPEVRKPETFEKALEAKQKEIAAGAEKRKARPQKLEPVNARAELEDLIGIEPAQRRAPQPADAGALPPDINRAMSKLEGKSFKMQKKNKKNKRSRRMLPIALGIVGALVLGGGAYALWHYKDNVSQLVASLMPASKATTSADTQKADVKSDATSPAVKTDVKTDTAQVKQPAKETEVASLNNNIGPQKFTQRLLADGTETDTDTAKVPIDQALPEGKTVAGQTEKAKDVAAATPTTATDAKANATNAAAPQDDAQPLGATQKMFLYEERLGQSSPVAVPGTIVWNEKADTEDGKSDPTIVAQINVPDRKITAMLTIKRNTDASLPASHIIEIVFALPKNFEEGNVDSIQRVAFKQTEQDRGNPLIAVPAKITDDFHMVALNDDADARKVNLELMKTRGWIDIPITYRNGRRALITLEKGTTGTAVFNKVMAEWDALGAQSNNNN